MPTVALPRTTNRAGTSACRPSGEISLTDGPGIGASVDVVVVGAGPAGCVAALAQAREGARVALLEANPRARERLAGEWLHPGGVEILRGLGVSLPPSSSDGGGQGFAVHPEDGSPAIILPYANGARGLSMEHGRLVGALREAASADSGIAYYPGVRVVRLTDRGVVARRVGGGSGTGRPTEIPIHADLVIAADGRTSCLRRALGLPEALTTISRMAGLRLEGASLPIEGYGHVFLGGPGPVLAYRIDPDTIRVCLDVPFGIETDPASLWEAYSGAFPATLHPSLARALKRRDLQWALNQTRPRTTHGREGLVLIGDAAGLQHPLTALGMTFAFADAAGLARSPDFEAFARRRVRETRVGELLAGVLYETFSEPGKPAAAVRHGVYALWRRSARERERTMRYLTGEEHRIGSFARTFARVTGPALLGLVIQSARRREPAGAAHALAALAERSGRLLRGLLRGRPARWTATHVRGSRPGVRGAPPASSRASVRAPVRAPVRASSRQGAHGPEAGHTLERAVEALVAQQRKDGRFEGEVRWCPMLAAQYVLFCRVMGIPIARDRRRGLLRHFERTRLESGLWGLHACSEPYLFVTTLVYVASRLLGVRASSPLLAPALSFIRREGVLTIPSWGKLWLALLGLYNWRGVPPLLPELWALPRMLPFHPSRFYCHTRQIYLAMSVLYGRRVRAGECERLAEIRRELYRHGMATVRWERARARLREAELNSPPSPALRLLYRLLAAYDRHRWTGLRRRWLGELEDRIRFELRTTDHTSLSPVSGLLNILALHTASAGSRGLAEGSRGAAALERFASDEDGGRGPEAVTDPDVRRAMERIEVWLWEDRREGTRIAGARSASWDSAFALQSLATARRACGELPVAAEKAIRRGAIFLREQQLLSALPGHREAFRIDPRGGFCFAGAWHGWPVSDCTAEALDALAGAAPGVLEPDRARQAVAFILRCQNPDGGFGSYEARRSRIGLEWLNPAEMFGESMTEHSYVECTASALAALAGFRRRVAPGTKTDDERPAIAATGVEEEPGGSSSSPTPAREVTPDRVDRAIRRAERRLRALQQRDGSWRGVWGVQFLYGTLFAVRGLVAAGAGPNDPALRRACAWVRAHQHADGGWGEDPRGCLEGRFVDRDGSQSIQTAWALMTLLEAGDPAWSAIARGADWLIRRQQLSGSWPSEEPAGLFFRTALLDYALYRAYFPTWALALYEDRRRRREAMGGPASRNRPARGPVRSAVAMAPTPKARNPLDARARSRRPPSRRAAGEGAALDGTR